jgi:hypothetical protein
MLTTDFGTSFFPVMILEYLKRRLIPDCLAMRVPDCLASLDPSKLFHNEPEE